MIHKEAQTDLRSENVTSNIISSCSKYQRVYVCACARVFRCGSRNVQQDNATFRNKNADVFVFSLLS